MTEINEQGCTSTTIDLCGENYKAVLLVQSKRKLQLAKEKHSLKKLKANIPDAVNWIITDWYEKNRVKLLMET